MFAVDDDAVDVASALKCISEHNPVWRDRADWKLLLTGVEAERSVGEINDDALLKWRVAAFPIDPNRLNTSALKGDLAVWLGCKGTWSAQQCSGTAKHCEPPRVLRRVANAIPTA